MRSFSRVIDSISDIKINDITTNVPWVQIAGGIAAGLASYKIYHTIRTKGRNNKVARIAEQQNISVCIIGAGISGICTAIKLKEAKIAYEVFERSEDLGGTWYENSYPACGCDVPAQIYSYTFNINTRWSASLVRRDEILQYFRDTAEKYGIREKISFQHEVICCTFLEDENKWEVEFKDLDTGVVKKKYFNYLITATGLLNQAKIPEVRGRETFKGIQFHTSKWDHTVSFKGKKVVGVGSGLSAIQSFPEIYKETKEMNVVIRSNTYFLERASDEKKYSSWFISFLSLSPALARFRAMYTMKTLDFNFFAFVKINPDSKPDKLSTTQKLFRWELVNKIKRDLNLSYEEFKEVSVNSEKEDYKVFNEERKEMIMDKLTPHYMPGCKRLAFSSVWYQMFASTNVKLHKKKILRVEPNCVVVDNNGEEQKIEADIIIWATGFEPQKMNSHIKFQVRRENNEFLTLNDHWDGVPKAYKGVTVDKFPNFFIMYGPNTNLGHTSVSYMIEQQCYYAIELIKSALLNGKKRISVKEKVIKDYNEMIQEKMMSTVFTAGCSNWYKSKEGVSPINWPLSVRDFRSYCQNVDFESYHQE